MAVLVIAALYMIIPFLFMYLDGVINAKEAFSGCITSSLHKDRIGVILAAIILPTDLASSITSEILGSSFKEKLFRGLTPNRRNSEAGRSRLTRSACLSSRVTSFPGAVLAKELR